MNKDFIKIIISTKDNRKDDRLIKRGDLVDLEMVELFCHTQSSNIDKAFYRYDDNPYNGRSAYFMQVKCPDCGEVRTESVSKTNIIDTVRKIKNTDKYYYSAIELLCQKCKRKKDEKEDKERRERKEERGRITKVKTDNYIAAYIDPDNSFKIGVKSNQKVNEIMARYDVDDGIIQMAIRNIAYSDFLKTPYWDGVRTYKLIRSGYCCQLCGKKGLLNVHHKNYQNHGMEHIKSVADDDPIVLCKDCHEKFHDKLNDGEVSA